MFAPVQNETSLRSIFMLLFVWFIRSSFRFSLKLFAWMFCQVNLLETGQYGDEDFNRKDFSSSYGHGGWIFHLENLCKIKDIFILYARFKLLYIYFPVQWVTFRMISWVLWFIYICRFIDQLDLFNTTQKYQKNNKKENWLVIRDM